MFMLHTVYQTLSRCKLFIFYPLTELVGIPERWRRSQAFVTLSVSNVFRYSSLAILRIRGFCLVEGREDFTRHRKGVVVPAEGGQLHTREETDIPGELLKKNRRRIHANRGTRRYRSGTGKYQENIKIKRAVPPGKKFKNWRRIWLDGIMND